MGYYVIEDFRKGVDLRRSIDTSAAGTLRVLRNAFINDGGEIEKARAFVEDAAMTAAIQSVATAKELPIGPLASPRRGRVVLVSDAASPLGGGTKALFGGNLVGGAPGVQWARASGIADPGDTAPPEFNSGAVFQDGVYVSTTFGPHSGSPRTYHAFGDIPTDDSEAALALISGRQEKVVAAHRQKMYVGVGPQLTASALLDPTDYAGTGSGSTSIRTQGANIGDILSLADYYEQLAVFGENGVQFWAMDPDFAKNQYDRSLVGMAVVSRNGVASYADGDIMAVATTGVRSVRARDSSNQAAVTDVGSPIDKLTRGLFRPRTFLTSDASRVPHVLLATIPDTGQLLVYGRDWAKEEELGGGPHYRMFLLSRFPAADVLAWSELDAPATPISNIAPIYDTICHMTTDGAFYVYGGADEAAYDTTEAEAVTPFLDLNTPGTTKLIESIDVACVGTWKIEIALDPYVDPADPDDMSNIVWETLATIRNSTHRKGRVPVRAHAENVAFRFTTSTATRARLGQIIIHHNAGEEG